MQHDLLRREALFTLEEKLWVPSEFGVNVKGIITSFPVNRSILIKKPQTNSGLPDIWTSVPPLEHHRSRCCYVTMLLRCHLCSISPSSVSPTDAWTWHPNWRSKGAAIWAIHTPGPAEHADWCGRSCRDQLWWLALLLPDLFIHSV